MTDRTDVNSSLPRDNLWVQRRNLAHIEVLQILWAQMLLFKHQSVLLFDDLFLRQSFEDERFLCAFLWYCFYHCDGSGLKFVYTVSGLGLLTALLR